ncbi:profilin, required for normal timing of actin polymerization in response to thermal stress [Dimargaris cristalligena]|uniref:Profilin n=1 Tax=Dimargaris cristalligena TaxID=215637 RepID=A0A4Q0A2Z6_9FUNG|nr:profilin, required for normal timing of actin polymerization in response to thermal stress [Dimargaris cristalligena]RKP39752.1 profilin [Dimargaris cristalligena]|eukprot:RKP39752.1 profilin [Dimargaris cristalligena]
MSWQPWADNIVRSGFQSGAICGQQGGVWASTPGCEIKETEIRSLADGFNDPTNLRSNGILVNGIKYFALQCDDKTLMGKKNDTGVICIKSKQAIVVGIYDSKLTAGQANINLNTVATNLANMGY